jgi:hypothetical protein
VVHAGIALASAHVAGISESSGTSKEAMRTDGNMLDELTIGLRKCSDDEEAMRTDRNILSLS